MRAALQRAFGAAGGALIYIILYYQNITSNFENFKKEGCFAASDKMNFIFNRAAALPPSVLRAGAGCKPAAPAAKRPFIWKFILKKPRG